MTLIEAMYQYNKYIDTAPLHIQKYIENNLNRGSWKYRYESWCKFSDDEQFAVKIKTNGFSLLTQ